MSETSEEIDETVEIMQATTRSEVPVTTTRDSYNLRPNSNLIPSMGHTFGPEAVCGCDVSWTDQQKKPTICATLLARLQAFENHEYDVKAKIADALRGPKAQIKNLELELSRLEWLCFVSVWKSIGGMA